MHPKVYSFGCKVQVQVQSQIQMKGCSDMLHPKRVGVLKGLHPKFME